MLKLEKYLIKHIEKYISVYFIFIVSIVGFLIRWQARSYISYDMKYYLLNWYNEAVKLGGIKSIGTPIGDYNIPYQFFIGIITNFSIYPVTLIKLLSIAFDYILAVVTALFTVKITKKNLFAIVYTVVIMTPTIFLNSGFWGQADSIYCSFIIISLILLKSNKFTLSFVFLGISLAFKLQTIFIIPMFCYYYLLQKKYSIVNMFLITMASFYAMCIPGFIYGRGFLEPITIYFNQANYSYIWSNYPSFWSILTSRENDVIYPILKTTSLLLCFAILLIGLFYLIKNKVNIADNKIFIYSCIWTVYTCVMFLVNIHDRYAYLLDILFIIAVFVDKNLFKYCIFSVSISLLVYGNYLFLVNELETYGYIIFHFLGIANLINYLLFSIYCVKKGLTQKL